MGEQDVGSCFRIDRVFGQVLRTVHCRQCSDGQSASNQCGEFGNGIGWQCHRIGEFCDGFSSIGHTGSELHEPSAGVCRSGGRLQRRPTGLYWQWFGDGLQSEHCSVQRPQIDRDCQLRGAGLARCLRPGQFRGDFAIHISTSRQRADCGALHLTRRNHGDYAHPQGGAG